MARLLKKKYGVLLFVVILLVISSSIIGNFFKDYYMSAASKKEIMIEKKETRQPWLSIFVHGSFGSTLGFLSTFKVLDDDVKGTLYKKVVGKMRKDSFFFQDQPLLERGLVCIEPSFNLDATEHKKFAAYPLLKIYEEISEYVKPGKERNYFYTFGWSGLISQKRRQLEALRFYNALQEELVTYHKKGIYPKIRIITHSHGGNLVAYLAAVGEVLRRRHVVDFKQDLGDKKALYNVHKLLEKLPNKEMVFKRRGQKKWDYKPEHNPFVVDEVLLWGMPVQPETDYLFASSLFKNVYHFYSDEDLVQRIDWVSTRKGYSDRRFHVDRLFPDQGVSALKNHFVQGRIAIGKALKKQKPYTIADVPNSKQALLGKKKREKKESFWSVLFSGGALLSPENNDPSHKELWFFSWEKNKNKERRYVLAPFPVMLFSPIMVYLLGDKQTLKDVDINISVGESDVEFALSKYKEPWLQTEFLIAKDFLDDMKKSVEVWRPKAVSSTDLFNIIRKYADLS